MSPMERQPYYFLENQIQLLVVDDDAALTTALTETLAPVPLYEVQVAHTARKAEELLELPQRCHVCILDLGVRDIKDDQFYLLRRFRRRASFIVLTASTSAKDGFTACRLGAGDLIEKQSDFNWVRFYDILNHYALLSVINPSYRPQADDPLSKSTRTLFDTTPENVTRWAMEMQITDREIRHIWKKNLGANTKIILFMYQLFTHAFGCYRNLLRASHGAAISAPVVPDIYKRQEEYFHCHRSTICDYIAFGNVVNFL